MSLDFNLTAVRPTEVFSANVTHNLAAMAQEAGLYNVLWRPTENDFNVGGDAILALERGLELLKTEPDRFKALNPENGWGSYDVFVRFVEQVLEACRENRDAQISVSR